MKSNRTTCQSVTCGDHGRIDRRAFLAKSIGYTTAITMFAFPGVINSTFASQAGKTNEEIFKELDEKVVNYFQMYKTCSQPSFAALNDQFNMKSDSMISALRPFAGGIVGKGETCGAVSGALLAIGAYFEPVGQSETKKPGASMVFAKQLFERFTEEFDHTRCREVIKHQFGRYYNWNDPEELKLFGEARQKENKCVEVVQAAVRFAAEIIINHS